MQNFILKFSPLYFHIHKNSPKTFKLVEIKVKGLNKYESVTKTEISKHPQKKNEKRIRTPWVTSE